MNFSSLFKKGIDYILERKIIIYSLVLLIVLPLFLFFQSYFIISSFQNHFNFELQSKASLAEEILDTFGGHLVSNPDQLQQKLKTLKKNTNDISDLIIAVPANEQRDEFKIIASYNEQDRGEMLTKKSQSTTWRNGVIAWREDKAFATLQNRGGDRFWLIIKPIHNAQGEKIALANMALSLSKLDALVRGTIFKAYLAVIIISILSVLIVANHARLFDYVQGYHRLRKANETKDEFLSVASHELKSPLTTLNWLFTALRDGDYGKIPAQAKKKLKQASGYLSHLNRLVEDILDVSRIQQRSLEIESKLIDPVEEAKKVLEQFRSQATEKGLNLEFKAKGEVRPIRVDSEKLQEVMTNLVSNAIKYTEEGKVVVKLFSEGDETNLIVEDTGIGMSAREREHLFEKFSRLSSGKKTGARGTGLGLWITKQVVAFMGGEIYVESMKGVGTKVSVVFPAVQNKKNKNSG